MTGAGTYPQRNGDYFLQATFERAVLVRSVHLGIGDMDQGWSREYLDGATIEFSVDDDLAWTFAATVSIPTAETVHIHSLPEPTNAMHWRIRKDAGSEYHLGISFLMFE
eukprot:gnl/TRDRNA2_/TRDRNA2_117141_c0_seq1.p1 gnl/TRDRNA2_/TRDRNA2_117141_c0~~gnl/TRDRNA2_/TRDRNA2_117141_c0_seq1.p1  ORF type:complete len:109 (+),score=11.31 gnl/TRDRNA2_/TRDRNA2_117141_c0_seq1:3-329(+)